MKYNHIHIEWSKLLLYLRNNLFNLNLKEIFIRRLKKSYNLYLYKYI